MFVTALSGIVGSAGIAAAQQRFDQATNTVQLVASRAVVEALHDYQNGIRFAEPPLGRDEHDDWLRRLVREMRGDLGVTSRSASEELPVSLYFSRLDKARGEEPQR
jgi:hypothetical protein